MSWIGLITDILRSHDPRRLKICIVKGEGEDEDDDDEEEEEEDGNEDANEYEDEGVSSMKVYHL